MFKNPTVCRYEYLDGNKRSAVNILRTIHVDALSESLLELSNRQREFWIFGHAFASFFDELAVLKKRNRTSNHIP
jgi:hypothetical protein